MPARRPLATVLSDVLDGLPVAEGPPPEIEVTAERLVETARTLKEHPELAFTLLYCVSGVDRGEAAKTIETVYHVASPTRRELVVLKVKTSRDNPSVPSVTAVWRAADWHERECFDMFGIDFVGHPDLRHLLLPDAALGYLLRKDVPIRTFEEARRREAGTFEEARRRAD